MKIDIQYIQEDTEEVSLKRILTKWLIDIRSVEDDFILYRKSSTNHIMNVAMMEIPKNKFKDADVSWFLHDCNCDNYNDDTDKLKAIEMLCSHPESDYTVNNLPTIHRFEEKSKKKKSNSPN